MNLPPQNFGGVMSVRKAVDAALTGSEDSWRVVLAQSLADALDDAPNASMARELRALMHEIDDAKKPEESSVADDLRARRAARIAASEDQQRSAVD